LTLLDTHVLVWLVEGDDSLGEQARRLADQALGAGSLAVSSISFWEVVMLQRRGRLRLRSAARAWRDELVDLGLEEIPVTGDLGIAAVELEGLHDDPADRIIVATAAANRAMLLTAGGRILDWPGTVSRHDARA